MQLKSLLSSILILVACLSVNAQLFTEWTGTGNWNTGSNWNNGYVYGQLEWKGNGNSSSNNDLNPASQWRLYFNSGTTYSITGNTVNLFDNGGDNSWILSDASANQNLFLDISFSDVNSQSSWITTRSTGNLNLNNVAISGNVTELRFAGQNTNGVINVNGVLSGAGKPVVIGRDDSNALQTNTRVEFDGANTYTGDTRIDAGILRLGSSGDLSDDTDIFIASDGTFNLNGQSVTVNSVAESGGGNSGVINLGSGTLTIDGDYAGTKFQNSISGTGSLVKNGAGGLGLFGTQSYTGTTTVNGGTLQISSDMSSSEIIVNSGATLSIQGNVSINDLTINAGGTVQQNGFTLTVNGDINTAGTYDFNGGGSPLIVNGNINVTGGTFSLSSSSGGDLQLTGDFTKSGGTFNCNERQILFNGSGNQLFQSTTTETINYLDNDNLSGTLTINSDVNVPNSSNLWVFGFGSSTTIPAAVTITFGDQTQLTSNSGGVVNVFGTVISDGVFGANFETLEANFVFENGGQYTHSTTRSGQTTLGDIPNATWNVGSTCLIEGFTDPGGSFGFVGDSDEQSFDSFIWNCPSQTTNVNLAGSTITANSFTMTSTGSGGVALGGSTNGIIDCVDYTHTNGSINFATSSGNGEIRCSGNFSQTGGSLTETGSGTGLITFDGASSQTIISTGSVTNEVSYRLNNSSGAVLQSGSTITINEDAVFYRTDGVLSGAGTVQYLSGGILSYDGTSAISTQSSEFPDTDGPDFLVIDNSAGVSLHDNRSLASGISLTDGLINLGSNNLRLETGGVINGTPSGSNHINTNGTGEFVREFSSSESGDFSYPIGNNGYAPISIDFTNQGTTRNLGFRAVDGNHPELNNPDAQANYLSRYWVASNSAGGSYLYNLTLGYENADVNGTESQIKINRWDGSAWNHYGSAIDAPNNELSTTVTLDETSAPIAGTYEITGRVKPREINENSDFNEFTTIEPSPSAEQSFDINATALTADIVITAPAGFSVSLTSGGPFSGSINITPTGGNLSSTPIYVQLDGTTAGLYSGNLTIASTGFTTISIPLIGTVLSPNTAIIDFDTDGNWTAGSGSISSYQTDHLYNQDNWEFTGGPALRRTTSNVDGVPGAFGNRAWQLNQGPSVVWTATYNFDGTANSFGMKIRRYDDNPSPNHIVEFSTDGGANFTLAIGIITNSFLGNTSKWKTLNYNLASPTAVGVGELIVRVTAVGTTERVMIDDFSYDITPSVCANPSVFFRSKNSGNWTNRGTWETSTTGTGGWADAQCAPDTDAQEVVVRNGHTVTVSSDIDFDELVIENGGILLHTGGIIDINNGSGADFTIENGGVYELDGGSAPTFASSALLQVQTGGIIRATQNQTGLSGDLAGTQSTGDIEYQDGAIFEWNNNLSFLSANQTYFPDAAPGVVPIFRVALEPGNVGAGSNTVINGLFEANANVNWQNTGTKTFRNGISGTGNVTQSSTGPCGPFQITGTAELGGTGTLSLNNNNLEIVSGATLTLISDKAINSTGGASPDLTINGSLNDGGFSILGDYNSVTVGVTGDVDVFNANGMVASGGTFTTSSLLTCAIGSVVRYQRLGDQTISGVNYADLIVQGSGLKSCDGAVSVRGFILNENASLGSEIGASLIVDQNFIIQSPSTFDQTAYDRLVISMLSNINASINSWTDVRCFNLLQNTTNNISLIGTFTQLEIKNLWNCDMSSGSGIFADNGKEILVGGDVFLRGGSSNFSLTGLLRFTGEQPTQSLEGSSADAEIFAEINELRVEGLTGTPVVNIPTDFGLTVKTNVDIVDGTLSMGQGILSLAGNWTNYAETGFGEGISRILFNGTGFQDITCPGGEIFSSITTTNTDPSGGIRLFDNLTLTGFDSDILDMSSGSVIDIQDHGLTLNGVVGDAPSTNIRVSNGICTILTTNPTTDSRILIQNSTKTVVSVSGGELQISNPITVRLENGLDCGAPDITTVSGILEIAGGGFIDTNPPVYPSSSRLRYVASTYTKGNEWNALSNQGYPNIVEVQGTDLTMNISSQHATEGDLIISNGGTLSIGNNGANGNLTIGEDVLLGPFAAGGGTLNLGDNFGGDIYVEGSFSLTTGSFNGNDREVIMTGGSAGATDIIGSLTFDFLAINYPSGTVQVTNTITINDRLRLTDGQFDFTTTGSDLIMSDNSRILRQSSTSTIDKEPILTGLDQYDVEYTSSMTADLEFSSNTTHVDELFLNGSSGQVTLTMNADRTFNGDLRLTNAILDLNGTTLSAAENVAGNSSFDAQIVVDGVDTCRVTGPANSEFQAMGAGGVDPIFQTKQVSSLNNTKLLFEENVLVRLGNGGFDFGSGNPTKIDGILEIAGGGYAINNSCYYGDESLLRFSNGFSYLVDAGDVTWDAGDIASGNPGIPYNVASSGDANTDLTLNSPRSLRNDLTITGSQFTLTVNSGTFEIGGDWIRSGATSSFNPNGQEVIFNGDEAQTINTFDGVASEEFFKVTFANSGIKTLQEDVTVLDELKIENDGNLNLGSNTIFLGGNWNNLANEAAVINAIGEVIFNGSGIQTISCPGGEVFNDITIDNSSELSEGIQLSDNITIDGNATFTRGIIHPTSNQEVIFGDGAVNNGGGLDSYVNGVVRYDGFSSPGPFGIFPVGDFEVIAPGDTMSVWGGAAIYPESSSAALNFTIQYFHENYLPGTSYPSNPPPVGPNLVNASTCNYWEVNRSGATISAELRLDWRDSTTCFDVQDPLDLRVVRWNAGNSRWEDMGGVGSFFIPNTVGQVTSDPITSFSPFTIGTTNMNNILPITLLSFQAQVVDGLVRTEWITASEINNDFFTIERSKDGENWEDIGTVDGAGDSNVQLSYAFIDDAPYTGISYYRLRQTDFDGTTTVSDPQAVEIKQGDAFGLDRVYRGQEGLNLVYRSAAPYLVVEIYDLLGKRVHGEILENYGNGFSIIHPNLARGAYVLRLSHGTDMDSEKFVY